MHFHKYPYPANFEFISAFTPKGGFRTRKGSYRIQARAGGDDVYHLQATGKG